MAKLTECPVCGAPVRALMHDGGSVSIEALTREKVVRCKDCKHRGSPYDCPMRNLVLPLDGPGSYIDCTEDEGFCHKGEAKEDEHGQES